jgi:hypothetical protein
MMLTTRKFMFAAAVAAAAQGFLGMGPAAAQSSVELCSDPMTDCILILVSNSGARPVVEILPIVSQLPSDSLPRRGQTVRLGTDGSLFWTNPPAIAEDTGS